jgi:4-oxalocrotonate tautomerase
MCAAPPRRTIAIARDPTRRTSVVLIQVKLLEGVFTAPQKREIVERLSDAMVEIEGESMRRTVWCVIDEVADGEWGVGGQGVTADDIKALARAESPPGTIRAEGATRQ